jgi:hypothetical protein
MQDPNHISSLDPSAAKACTAWCFTGIGYVLHLMGLNSWGDVASFLAAIYSAFLIGEWLYKKLRK